MGSLVRLHNVLLLYYDEDRLTSVLCSVNEYRIRHSCHTIHTLLLHLPSWSSIVKIVCGDL